MTSNAGLPATADPDRVSAKQDPTLHLLTTEELRSELGRAIGLTVQSIVRVATIWAELERRGEDLSDIRFTLKAFLPLVARGQLAPEAVVEMAGQQRKLELFSRLPIEQQRPLLAGQQLQVYKPDGTQTMTVSDMTLAEAALVIRDGVVRTVHEQELAARSRARTTTARKGVARRGRRPTIRIDEHLGTVRVGTVTVALEDLLAALRQSDINIETTH